MSTIDDNKKNIVVVRVSGKDKGLWVKTVGKFKETIKNLLDLQVDQETGATVRDEIQDYIKYGSQWVKESLQKPKTENILKLQEAAKLAAERINLLEEAEGKRIENVAAKFKQQLKQMKFYLLLAKAGAFDQESDNEVLLFAKSADAWLFAINEMEKGIGA